MESVTIERMVDVEKIIPHLAVPNVRDAVKKSDITELVNSIKQQGLLSPLLVFTEESSPDSYFLISGFRRYRAIQEILAEDPKHHLQQVPVFVRKADYKDALYLNLVENIQRKDLSPIEIAKRVKMLIDRGFEKQEICKNISKSVSWINATLHILDAEQVVQDSVEQGAITIEEGKKIAKLPNRTQETVTLGVVAARESGDKKTKKKIKTALEEATTGKRPTPTKPEIRFFRNAMLEISRAMKKNGDKDAPEYLVVCTGLKILDWILGDTESIKVEKYIKKYNLDLDKEGNAIKPAEKLPEKT